MQSQLAAALLGQSGSQLSSSTPEEEEKDEPEEEADDIDEEIIDEENELEAESRGTKTSTTSTSRTITLQMLLDAGILQPGNGTMSIEYLGQRFLGDLLTDGKIKSQETDLVFASPSAWAIHCKRIINPDKKSGCGWASVKYKGRKLDAYKNTWFKRKQQEEQDKEEDLADVEMEAEMERIEAKLLAAPAPLHRVVMKHNTVPNRAFTHDANTLIECVPFSTLGKIQPFLISFSTNACLLMDFHCHLTMTEVCGYLGGQWDVNAHTLSITHAFPCRVLKADRQEFGPQVDKEIQEQMEKEKLTLVGWYHSHPTVAAAPTYKDIDSQLEYQIRMKGDCDSTYTPCVGVICSPYNLENTSLESSIISYWVIPPLETKPNEYGRPMLMSYSVVQDSTVTPPVMDEMKKTAQFYRKEKDFINFQGKFNDKVTYLEKLKTTLSSKFPRDQSEMALWGFIRELVGCPGEEKIDTSVLLTIPKVLPPPVSEPPKISTPLSTTSTPTPQISTTLPSNLMLTTDLASVLFQSGKFPTALLGIPDPMSRQTLAANNMFLTPSLFKMQDTINLLKPLSTSSPIASTSKTPELNLGTPIKIPSDITLIKPPKLDFSTPDLNLTPPPTLKTPKIEISPSDFNVNKSKIEFSASDLSISSVKPNKIEFTASDLSISSAKTTSDIFSQMLDMSTKNKSDFSVADLTGISPAKIPKTDYPTLDLSLTPIKNNLPDTNMGPSDLSMPSSGNAQTQPLELSTHDEQMKPMSLITNPDEKNK